MLTHTFLDPQINCRDFSKTELPAIAKIVKGQHQNLGVPTLSNPSLQSTALFLNAGKKYQILAQPIKIKEGRKPTSVGELKMFNQKFDDELNLIVRFILISFHISMKVPRF